MQVTLFAFGSGDTSVFGWTVAPNFKPTAQGAQNNQQRGLTMRTHSYGWISSARLQLRGVLVLCGLLLGYQPAARADTGWAATATQGITLTNFAIQAHSLGPLAGTTPLRIMLGLQLQNATQLNSAILAINTPGNPSYGKFLTPSEFAATYSPSSAQVQAVESYLSRMGFTNISAPSNGLYVVARGTAAAIEAAFNTTLWQYRVAGPNGEPTRTVYANTQPAQVPASLGGIVLSVVGLQNIDTMHTFLGAWPAAAPIPAVTAPSMPANPVTFYPQDFWQVYDVGAIAAASNTTIAIFAEGDLAGILPDPSNPSAPSDLRQFESENKLPQVPVQIVQVGLGSSDTSGAIEFDMDTQESTGMAGTVKQLIVYDADSMNDIDLIPGFNDFVTQNKAQAGSASFGGCDTLEYLSGAMPLYDQIFRQAAVQGQTVFASTGDSGSACGVVGDTNGVPLSGVPAMVEFPASDTYVMAAGGTTILVDSNYNIIKTTAWDAGGGGFSLWEYSGAWQSPFVPVDAGSSVVGVGKGLPDVAMDADFLLSPAGFVSGGGDTTNGGTSLASPLSLGSWARIEGAHKNVLGFAGPVLYALATPGAPFSTITGMTDVTLGTNGIYAATVGWDFTTGLGSFDIAAVSARVGQTGGAALSPCTLPGTLVVSQNPGSQVGAPANAQDDVTGVSIAEPYPAPTPPETLEITMTVADLATLPALPPNTFWKVYFSYQGQVYFVDMDTIVPGGTPTAPEFAYGVTTSDGAGGNGDSTLGAISGSYNSSGNTISWALPANLILPPVGTFPNVTAGTQGTPPRAGAQLSSVHGVTQMLLGADAGLLETISSTPDGTYTMVGNVACNPAAPVVALLAASPASGTAPLAVTLDASASHPPLNGGKIKEYTFNFGDGSASVTQSTPTAKHSYSGAGTYDADAIVTDTGGGTGTSAKVAISVHAPTQPPVAAIAATPSSGTVPLTVKFNASGSHDPNSGGSIKQYSFNFGDGSALVTQSTPTVSHVYSAAANHVASVTVTDGEGGTASATVTVKTTQ
jgi:pseudomonalisin/xanthomonalisin